MKASTIVARIARVQTAVSLSALALVVAGTLALVDTLLVWKADHHLESVIDRAARYLDATTPEDVDWRWLADEVEEVRPSDVRVEVDDRGGRVRIARGFGRTPQAHAGSCVSQGLLRGCARAHRGFVLRAARSRADDRDVELHVALALIAAGALAGVAVAFSSRAVTRRAVRPLLELGAYVNAVEPGAAGRVAFRSDLAELDGLARRFDDVVERFDAALAREKRFSAEASHELRTPLTIVRAELEELRDGAGADPEGLNRAVASIDRLSSLVDALLWFARAQGRLDMGRLELVNLADLVRAEVAVVERMHGVALVRSDLPDEALVKADEDLLRRAVANLLENAAKHGGGRPLTVALRRSDGRAVLSVVNGGQAIPPDLREGIFEPFFRVRHATPATAGFGLGLPFARAVARSHGGDIELGDAGADEVEMLLSLPLVEWHDGS